MSGSILNVYKLQFLIEDIEENFDSFDMSEANKEQSKFINKEVKKLIKSLKKNLETTKALNYLLSGDSSVESFIEDLKYPTRQKSII